MSQKVLIVDDSRTIRAIVANILKTCDCEVFEAENGEEGLAITASEMPDVIMIDTMMPVMDGITMVARLHADAELNAIPIIMLVPEADRAGIAQIPQLGVRDHLVKPFKNERLIEKVGRVIPLGWKVTA